MTNPNVSTPSALPMIRSQYTDLAQKSGRIKLWMPIACFASLLIHMPFLLAVGGGIALLAIRKSDRKKLDDFYRENIVPMCLTQVFGNYEYSVVGSVPERQVQASGLIAPWQRFHGDTFIKADCSGTDMMMSNLELKGTAADKEKVVFKGPFATFLTHRHNTGNVWIFEKDFVGSNYGADAGRVLTGTPEFDARYNVYASDPAAVRRVLDFETMNAIMDAESKLPGKIRFSLVNGILYMAVDGGEPLLSTALKKGQKQPSDIDELTARAMFEVCTLLDIARVMAFDH